MKNKVSISVGISAYNEGKNIKNVIVDVLGQKQKSWNLLDIFVYCDNCSDDTAEKAREVKNAKVRVFEGKSRKGKPYRLGQIFQKTNSDITVIFDGDVKLGDENIIEKIIQPILKEKNVVLVGGNTRPLEPKTFFEKGVFSTFLVFYQSRTELRGGNNLFGCTGACMAIKTSFAKEITFPKVINEDDFLYFSCISKGFTFRYVDDAHVYYKLPTRVFDYLRQIFRSNPEAVRITFKKHFGDLVQQEYERPHLFYIKSIVRVFLKFPLPVCYIIMLNILARPFFPLIASRYKLDWHRAESTKEL